MFSFYYGERIYMKILDRIKFIEPYKLHNGIILPINTYGTIREMLDNHEIVIQTGILFPTSEGADSNPIDNKQIIPLKITVPDLIIDLISQDELINVDYRLITSKIFHPGNMWSVKVDYDKQGDLIYKSGIIEEYFLALSEDDDEVTLTFLEDIYNSFKDNIELEAHKYKVRYLNTFGSYSIIIE